MPKPETTHVRYLIVLMLFVASTFSYGDRVVLSIAAVDLSKELHMDALRLGYLFSGFGWAYGCLATVCWLGFTLASIASLRL